eukprot:CAMPEP_0118929390 /NCGR_PEP_ID=MMETSP1169-20130426/6410_1 /TAXON_ID=36882 /ORGANISM="Pyramimonas obovata, Strain CCMP722" /LENGTH=178 /DNA_ID=CAMNT_0006871575 /DNA_START=106 /DNA_END=640 /DNA_ORIENTATION=-
MRTFTYTSLSPWDPSSMHHPSSVLPFKEIAGAGSSTEENIVYALPSALICVPSLEEQGARAVYLDWPPIRNNPLVSRGKDRAHTSWDTSLTSATAGRTLQPSTTFAGASRKLRLASLLCLRADADDALALGRLTRVGFALEVHTCACFGDANTELLAMYAMFVQGLITLGKWETAPSR